MTLPLRLTGRSSSHFTRVARIIAHEVGVPLELDVVRDLASVDAADYGGNPALKIPTLHVGGVPLFGTDNICRKLAEIAGRGDDPRVVLTEHVTSDVARSAQELVWHAMAAQVQVLLGDRAVKAEVGMRQSLAWVEAHLDEVLAALPSPRVVSVFEVTVFCLLEHIALRGTTSLDAVPKLRALTAAFAARASARETVFRFDPGAVPTTRP